MLGLQSKRTGRRPLVALYARVSTINKQELDNQTRELRLYCKRNNWDIFETYTDQASGASKNRPGLDAMLEAAARKQFDAVVIFDLSRITRGGPATAFLLLQRLQASGVELWSYREEYFRTPVAGPILFAVAAWFAELEREMIRARVKAGMDRAREKGVTFGRPKNEETVSDAELIEARREGLGIRKLAVKFRLGKGTIERRLNEIRSKEKDAARRKAGTEKGITKDAVRKTRATG